MDADEIRTLLGDNIFERAKKYRKRIQQSTCTVNADGVRHISAMVQGNGGSYYYTQAWLPGERQLCQCVLQLPV